MRKGVKFHHGPEVIADDFVYSFTRLMDPKIESAVKSTFERVKGVQAFVDGQTQEIEGLKTLDDYTLQIELSQPYAPLVRALGMWASSSVGDAALLTVFLPVVKLKRSGAFRSAR